MRPMLISLLVGVCAGGVTAHADGYVAVGAGAGATFHGEMASHFEAEKLPNGRVALGYRFGSVALEAVGLGGEVLSMDAFRPASEAPMTSLSLGVDVKLFIELFADLEVFGRAGVHRTWITTTSQLGALESSYEGEGQAFGFGAQYSVSPLPMLDMAVWMDFDLREMMLYDGTRRSLSGGTQAVTFGASLGF